MENLNSLWENYSNFGIFNSISEEKIQENKSPKCSDIYISTKTKIGYLNSKIDLYDIFWKIPVFRS